MKKNVVPTIKVHQSRIPSLFPHTPRKQDAQSLSIRHADTNGLLSCHTIDGQGLYDGSFMKGKTQKEYNEAYYNEVLAVVQNFKKYSVLAHLDLIRRYDKTYYPFEKTRQIVEKILKQVIADGKGIEVNTSCYRYNIPDLTPSVEILKLYKDLGGEIITIGSDSHAILHFGNKIAETHKHLRKLGFKSFYTFDKMTPTRHDLFM